MTRKLGTLEPVVYFVNHKDPAHPDGFIMLAPYTSYPTPEGYSRHEADTLAEVDKLQKQLMYQEATANERDYLYDQWLTGGKYQEVGDRLYARMTSSATSEYEKDFIKAYLQVIRPEKREIARQRWLERQCYLSARENDIPKGRRADEEAFKVDRIG